MYCDRVPMKNRITLAAILVSATLTVMAGAIVAPALNPMAAGLGVSPAAARLIITTHAILIAVCSPFMGMAIDAWGVRRPFAAGLIFYGLAGASGLLAPGYWTIIAGRVALGVAVAAVYTAVTVSIFRLYSGAERNKVMGWRASSNALGGMVWPLLGGLLAGVAWRLPFSVYLIGIPLGLLVLTQLPTAETGDAAADEAETAAGAGTDVRPARPNSLGKRHGLLKRQGLLRVRNSPLSYPSVLCRKQHSMSTLYRHTVLFSGRISVWKTAYLLSHD